MKKSILEKEIDTDPCPIDCVLGEWGPIEVVEKCPAPF